MIGRSTDHAERSTDIGPHKVPHARFVKCAQPRVGVTLTKVVPAFRGYLHRPGITRLPTKAGRVSRVAALPN